MYTKVAYGMYLGVKYNEDSEGNKPTHEQLKNRPKIDDVICHFVDGELLKEALFIIDNIRIHQMKIKWSAINLWSVWYKRKHVCDLSIENGSLNIGPVNDVLATCVKNMSHDNESIRKLIYALRDSMTGAPEAIPALQ